MSAGRASGCGRPSAGRWRGAAAPSAPRPAPSRGPPQPRSAVTVNYLLISVNKQHPFISNTRGNHTLYYTAQDVFTFTFDVSLSLNSSPVGGSPAPGRAESDLVIDTLWSSENRYKPQLLKVFTHFMFWAFYSMLHINIKAMLVQSQPGFMRINIVQILLRDSKRQQEMLG